MTDLSEVTRLPEDFDGVARLFPLPDLVVLPHAMQPLHIFEPRYCALLAESLATDRLIAMATTTTTTTTPKSGHGVDPFVCVGKVVSHALVDTDQHNILLVGAKRAKIITEIDVPQPYRAARVEIIDDIYTPAATASRHQLKADLLRAFGSVIPPTASVQQNLHELMAGAMQLGPITDIIAYNLPFSTTQKLSLLAMADVDERAVVLIELLQGGHVQLHSVTDEEQSISATEPPSGERQFPPPFSVN